MLQKSSIMKLIQINRSIQIQFSSITVSMMQNWSIMKQMRFNYKAALEKSLIIQLKLCSHSIIDHIEIN